MNDIFDDDDGIGVSGETDNTERSATQVSKKTINLLQNKLLNKGIIVLKDQFKL